MEKPDADGYVNVVWPSKTIPHGGIFHTRVVEPSTTQQQFLKVLLEESKLDIAQRRKSALALRRDDDKPQRSAVQMQIPVVRPRTSKRRSLSAIRESGIFEMDPYCPKKRGEDREKLKERLAKCMEYGKEPDQPVIQPPPASKVKGPPVLPSNKEMWNDIVTQIRERADWLAEMEYLGQAAPHREIIQDQIAERMRMLDALGVDSTCVSARSSASGFSTTRSKELKTTRSQDSAKSGQSNRSKNSKKQSTRPSPKGTKPKEENVAAYGGIITPLQYSPRRRV
ncbi:UPF0193 protein EVG1 homolog [Amyelois transitella]|uniref:UPF0193 protein EVG1 homolog n=1 Tax=Amyelois transitella TaxID=680683 RepID=UPI00067B8D30|nr:UPF0193 protein EVG1 homolog [Amyelois transitella]XP_060802924.1 UPF0193 protein EVG1 homolog [Amyelois transitella]